MIWPFNRRAETRESGYTDLLVQAAVNRAKGTADATAAATGALESCAGAVGRAFAAAEVKGPPWARAALTPALMALAGRSLIRSGELVAAIDVTDGAVSLWPASSYDVQGGYRPESWTYRLNLSGPSVTMTRPTVPAEGVIHLRYAVEPVRPWAGIGPLQFANLAGRLSAETVAALGDEASDPRGAVLPLPVEGNDPTVAQLKADIKTLAGHVATVESTRTMHPGAPGSSPQDDWKPRRLGFAAPESLVDTAARAFLEVCAACGVPAAFFEHEGDTGQRESFRRFLHGTVQPLGRLVQRELSEKLDADVTLSFDSLFAGDLSGRAPAFQSLVKGGMALDKAAALAGLMESDDG